MGEIVTRGSIKVDARRARDKLRDHQLNDPHLYGEEILRAAVALGASTCDVVSDADDAIFTMDRTLPVTSLTAIRDHAFAGAGDGAVVSKHDVERAARLLGIAVNAALGLSPSFVDLVRAEAGVCTRVRFRGDADPVVTSVPPSRGMPRDGLRVHVRHAFGLDVVGRAVKGETLQEIEHLRTVAEDAPLRVTIGGREVRRTPSRAVLRMDLGSPAGGRAWLEILHAPASPRTELAEYGVRLLMYDMLWGARASLSAPVRLLVDVPHLPTNISRSQLRTDSDLAMWLADAVPRAFTECVEALVALVEGRPCPADVEVVDAAGAEDALGAIVSGVALDTRAGIVGFPSLRSLLDKPLLVDAIGRPLAPSALPKAPFLVYSGEQPLDPALAPWLAGVPWNRRRPIDVCFTSIPHRPADDVVHLAKQGLARRLRAMSHPPSPPALATASGSEGAALVSKTFTISSGPFSGLMGEVAVMTPASRFLSTARVFVEDRLLDTIPLPGAKLPVAIALAWPGHFQARFAYDGVERSESLDRAMIHALLLAALGIGEVLARHETGVTPEPELVRAAVATWSAAMRQLEVDANVPGVVSANRLVGKKATVAERALAAARVWPSSHGTLLSLAELAAYANRTHAVCVAPRGAAEPVDGRPVLAQECVADVAPLLAPAEIVPYRSFLRMRFAPRSPVLDVEASHEAIVVPFTRGDLAGFVAPGPPSTKIFHTGVLLSISPPGRSRWGPIRVVVDDPGAVPTPSLDGTSWSTPFDVEREEDELVLRALTACEGDQQGGRDAPLARWLASLELDGASKRSKGRLPPDLVARIAALPARLEAAHRGRQLAAFLGRRPSEPRVPLSPPVAEVRREGRARIAASLAPEGWPQGRAEVFFRERTVGTAAIPSYDLAARVDIEDDALIESSFAGLEATTFPTIDKLVADAALALADLLLALPSFLSQRAAVTHVTKVLVQNVSASAVLSVALYAVKWPTVQGAAVTLEAAGRPVPFGQTAYAPYRTANPPSPYDAPALLLDERSRALLVAAGFSLVDVTEPIARLQARRTRGQAPIPRLSGSPSHPLLRATFDELGVASCEGEVEIADGVTEVGLVDSRGVATAVSLILPYPARMLVRTEALDDVAPAMSKLARRLAPSIAHVPPFARLALRHVCCREGLTNADMNLPIWPDIHGAFRSIAGMNAGKVAFTRDVVPHLPPLESDASEIAPLVLEHDFEVEALRKRLSLHDVTKRLRAQREGAVRRAAPPIHAVELPPELRACCMRLLRFDEGAVRGEVGLLAPDQRALAGIRLHHTRRFLTMLTGRRVWPVVAVVDADFAPNPAFDALLHSADAERVETVVRKVTARAIEEQLVAPPDAVSWVRAHGTKHAPHLGIFWLEEKWPEDPRLEVQAVGTFDPARRPRIPAGVVPVRGRIWTCAEGPKVGEVVQALIEKCAPRLAKHAARTKDPETYAWDFALLGYDASRNPLVELARDRPDETLVHVVVRRAPHLLHVPDEPTAVRVGSAPAPPLAPPEPTTAVTSLANALRALRLTGDPVTEVVQVETGRPVRYEAARRRIVVNVAHASIRALAKRETRDVFLVAAAVSEINRELLPVTDAEERAVLVDLLR